MGSPFPGMDPYLEHPAWWQDFHLRDPLPKIPVPLRAPDPDVSLELADVFRTTYERGAYERDIYRLPPVPAVRQEDLAWVTKVPDAIRRG